MKVLIFILFIPLSSHAVFQKIYSGYKVSDRLAALKINKKIFEASLDFGENKHSWELDIGTSYKDSSLQSLYSFQSNKTISNTLSVGFSKSSYKYGSFSFSHDQTNYDISNWASSSLNSFSGDTVYEAKNTLGYKYNFLNNSERLDWDVLINQNQSDNLNNQLSMHKDFLDFFTGYNSAKLGILLDGLYKDFEKRAVRRVNLVSKRVRDGLSRNFELNQSKLSLLSQQETILRNQNSLREKVMVLEEIIGLAITEKEYSLLSWSYKTEDQFKVFFNSNQNLELELLKKMNQLTDLNIHKLKEESDHNLSLSLSYIKNAVNIDQNDALSDSFGNGVNDEKTVALTYTIPLGSKKLNSLKKQLLIQRNKNLLSEKNLKGQLEVQKKYIKENLTRYEKGIKLLKQKVKIANDSIKEHQKLYIRGQISFEEMLRSEETFINAKISQLNMLAIYDLSMAQLAFLNGNIVRFLDSYVD